MKRRFRGLLILPALASVGWTDPLPNPKDEQATCAVAEALFHNYRREPDVFYRFSMIFKICPRLSNIPPHGINIANDKQVDDIARGAREGEAIWFDLPQFNKTRTKARINRGITCGPLCGGSGLIYLRKTRVGWKVIKDSRLPAPS